MNDLIEKIRSHLDRHRYQDVELRVLGGYSWAKADYKSEIARAVVDTYKEFNLKYVLYPHVSSGDYSPSWPVCAFSKPPLSVPIAVGGLGHGGRAHSPNEYFVIEGVEAKTATSTVWPAVRSRT